MTYCCDISDVPPAEAPFRNVVLSLVGVGACLRTPIPMLELQTMLARQVTTLNNLSSGWLASTSFHKWDEAWKKKKKNRTILFPNFQNSMHIYLISLKASKIHVFMPPRKMWRQAKKKSIETCAEFHIFFWKYAQKYRQTLTLVFEWPNPRNA